MIEIICINDTFSPEWEIYFQKQGIQKPVKDAIYTVRDVVDNMVGEKGLLLVEIVNKPTPRISPSTGLEGFSEQNWAISRFTTLLGEQVTKEEINNIKREAEDEYQGVTREVSREEDISSI